MIPLLIITTTLPSMFAAGCAAVLALKDRKQWIWFAALAVLAGVGGILTLGILRAWNYPA